MPHALRGGAAVFLAGLVLALPAAGDEPDRVTLKMGDVLSGRVVYEDDEVVVLRSSGRDRELPCADVAQVSSRSRELDALLDWLDVTSPDADAFVARAAAVEAAGLPGEARLLRLRAVLLAPDHAAANDALGHKRKSGRWTWKRGNAWKPVAEIGTAGLKWDERWVLGTLRYQVSSNLPLAQAIDAAFDLEREQRAVRNLFRGHLRLLDGDDLLLAQLHADMASFPEFLGNRRAYYDPASLTLFINATQSAGRTSVAHEAMHQILHVSTRRTKEARGQIPSWLDEGLAQYSAAALRGDPGHATFDFGALFPAWLATHADAREPYDLKRVLTFEADDFGGTVGTELKYAQSYSLVAYCLLGDGGAQREGFFAFLRSAWLGRSSMSDFKKCLGDDLDGFERGWTAWVQANASG